MDWLVPMPRVVRDERLEPDVGETNRSAVGLQPDRAGECAGESAKRRKVTTVDDFRMPDSSKASAASGSGRNRLCS